MQNVCSEYQHYEYFNWDFKDEFWTIDKTQDEIKI